MKITFLGTGTSQGVPLIACECGTCSSSDTKDNRLRTSIMIEDKGTCIVIDSGPDFRQQMLREKVKNLDALVFTHSHKDHLAGMDDIRAFNFIQQKPIDVFCTLETEEVIRKDFDYIFNNSTYPGIPKINLHRITKHESIKIGNIELRPIEVFHFKMPVLGFRIKNFTYITDANFIAPEEMGKIKGSDVLVLNALRKETHISHFTLQEAIEVAEHVSAQQTYFTHISHQLGKHEVVETELPSGMYLAYDCLQLNL